MQLQILIRKRRRPFLLRKKQVKLKKGQKIKLGEGDGGLMMRNAVIGLGSVSFFDRLENCPQPDLKIPSQGVFPKHS